MASERSDIVLVLVALTSSVSALEFTQMSNEGNDVLGWTCGAQVDQPAVLPGPITEPWVPSEDIADTLERMCRYKCLVSTTYRLLNFQCHLQLVLVIANLLKLKKKIKTQCENSKSGHF